MTSLELTPEQVSAGYRPLAGRVLLEIEANPDSVGRIIVPEVARDKTMRDALQVARVLAIDFGAFYDAGERISGIAEGDVAVGDRVLFLPLAQDLNRKVILTATTRVVAVLE